MDDLKDIELAFCNGAGMAVNFSRWTTDGYRQSDTVVTTSAVYFSAMATNSKWLQSVKPTKVDEELYTTQSSATYEASPYVYSQYILYCRVIVVISVFGFFNLLILIPRGLQYSLGRIEKFAYSGLIALAVSDMLFCSVVFPQAFIELGGMHDSLTFELIYDTYKDAVINVFTLSSSTWLTVTLAVGRYVAICHPLRARELIEMTFAKRSLCLVFALCVLFNIPRFWMLRVAAIHCENGRSIYFKWNGFLRIHTTLETAYMWTYCVVGILLPLLLLVYCNWHLILAMRVSRHRRRQMRAPDGSSETNSQMTLILITVVVMYVVLVSPAELISFFGQTTAISHEYNLAVVVVNMLQSINFSLNLFIYYGLSAQFRRSAFDLLTGQRKLGTSRDKKVWPLFPL